MKGVALILSWMWALLLLGGAAPGQEAPGQEAPGQEAPGQQAPGEYPIGAKDLLEIKVLEIPELNVERRVSDGGAIALPLIGDFPVEGLTPTEARSRLETLLKEKYVNRANVSVIVKEYASKPVSVVGAVRKPGSLNISGRWTLLQAISAAGGLTETAGNRIFVLRKADKGLSDTLEVDTDELFHSANPIWNIPIIPGDVVNVAPRRTIKIFCIGELKSPGALELTSDDRITLLSVIARAGGPTDRASSKMRIKRRGPDGKDTEIVVDYKRILSGKDRDPILEPNDVVIVKESFF